MQLMYSPTSPYVRKVMIVAHELDLLNRFETVPCATTPTKTNPALALINPIAKVPTLLLDDGVALFDSPVICEYLASLSDAQTMFPPVGQARWQALRGQALGDGILDAALLVRYETLRPENYRSPEWIDAQMAKIVTALPILEAEAAAMANRVDIGTVTIACTLSYLDLRYAELGWHEKYPALASWFETFSKRPSFKATAPE
jgi:glutathione S-transferase